MKVLELFAGSRSVGKEAERQGHEVFSSDINGFEDIDYCVDILDFDVSKVPFVPDFLWASPPCTFFSVASIGKHWHPDHTPKTPQASLGVSIVKKTLEIIDYFLSINPKMIWYMENPRGKLRKLEVVSGYDKATVTYCSYGDMRMKPTDIWSNNLFDPLSNVYGWKPIKMCHSYKYDSDGNIINRHCHHESARRGAKTGTQGIKGNYNRSKIPQKLCEEILRTLHEKYKCFKCKKITDETKDLCEHCLTNL
tara:strand:+ start:3074 stop:3826 length:753 start_codon:yes stop_codon:yes gene_type:complete